MGPHLRDFLERYPAVSLDLEQDDRFADLATAGIDVAIRSGEMEDSTHGSRLLTRFRFLLCASPDYLAKAGTPGSTNELQEHSQIRFRFPGTERLQSWRPGYDDALASRTPALVSTNMEGVLAAALAGVGVAQLPDFLARADLATGRLRIIEMGEPAAGSFRLLWPHGSSRTPKVRALIDYLVSCFA